MVTEDEVDRRIEELQDNDLATVLRDTAERLNTLADRLESRIKEAEAQNDGPA